MHLSKETNEMFAYSSLDRQRYTPTPKPASLNDIPLSPPLTSPPSTNTTSNTAKLARTIRDSGPDQSKKSTLTRLFQRSSIRASLLSLPEKTTSKTSFGEEQYYATLKAACPRMAETKGSSQPSPENVVVRPVSSQITGTEGVLGSPVGTSATLTANSKDPSDGPTQPYASSNVTIDLEPTDSANGRRAAQNDSAEVPGIIPVPESRAKGTNTINVQSPQVSNRDSAEQSTVSSYRPESVTLPTNSLRPNSGGLLGDGRLPVDSTLLGPSDRNSETIDQEFIPARLFARPLPDPADFTVNSRISPQGRLSTQFQVQTSGPPQEQLPPSMTTARTISQGTQHTTLLAGSKNGRHYIPEATMALPQGPPPTPAPTGALPLAPDGTSGRIHYLPTDRVNSLSGRQAHVARTPSSRSAHVPHNSYIPFTEDTVRTSPPMSEAAAAAIKMTRDCRMRKELAQHLEKENRLAMSDDTGIDQVATGVDLGKRRSLGKTVRYSNDLQVDSNGLPFSRVDIGKGSVATVDNNRRSSLAREKRHSLNSGISKGFGTDRLRPSDSERIARHVSMTSVGSTTKRTSYGGSHQEATSSLHPSAADFIELRKENAVLRAMLNTYLNESARPRTPSHE
ncbi:MAG: hypothetical protein M1812_005138 [Candelaria pacifica]|nr:MAG: hypothetical protein M1812_005138 [Candelaria pacifica]